MKATTLLKKQHREVKALFGQVKKATPRERREILETIGAKLDAHMAAEEDVFYPALAEIGTKKADEMVPEAYEEHHVAKLVLRELPEVDPDDERFEAKMTVLEELIEHHVEEEEKELFKLAEKLGDERLEEIGARIAEATEEPAPSRGNGRARGRRMAAAATAVALALAIGAPSLAHAADPATTGEAAQQPSDNTGRNVRDRDDATLTPMDQSSKPADLDLTQSIRKQVVGDDSLSTNAQNVKIITVDGVVTLRGPVESAAEKSRIGAMASNVAGAANVRNQLEVAEDND